MSDASIDRTRLPIRRAGFSGTVNRTLAGSQPDWGQIASIQAPEGAPNVLLVLIDDAGFGQPSIRRPGQHPELHPDGRGWSPVQPLPCDRALLADAGRAS